jgi:hypothetical protein
MNHLGKPLDLRETRPLTTDLDVIGIVRAKRLGVRDAPTVRRCLTCARAFGALALISDRSTKYAFLGRKSDSWCHDKGKDKEEGCQLDHSDVRVGRWINYGV